MTYDSSTVSDTNGDASIRQRSRFTAEDENFLGTTGELKTERRTSAKPPSLTFLHSCCATPPRWKSSNLFQDKDLTASTLPDTSPGSWILNPPNPRLATLGTLSPTQKPRSTHRPKFQIRSHFSDPEQIQNWPEDIEIPKWVAMSPQYITQRVPSSPQEPKLR